MLVYAVIILCQGASVEPRVVRWHEEREGTEGEVLLRKGLVLRAVKCGKVLGVCHSSARAAKAGVGAVSELRTQKKIPTLNQTPIYNYYIQTRIAIFIQDTPHESQRHYSTSPRGEQLFGTTMGWFVCTTKHSPTASIGPTASIDQGRQKLD
mmetsp:Transcript_27752/g.44416  ORF Transcript_27752/g.44416 Transcript_27752/m.44416 type:complete len:152 (+) Transcript_27752:159-614(+)